MTIIAILRRLRLAVRHRYLKDEIIWIVEQEPVPRAPWIVQRLLLRIARDPLLIVDHDDANYLPLDVMRSSQCELAKALPARKRFVSQWHYASAIVAGNRLIELDINSAVGSEGKVHIIASGVNQIPTSAETPATALSTARYHRGTRIGWIGSKTTVPLFAGFSSVVRRDIESLTENISFVAIGPADPPDFDIAVEYYVWNAELDRNLSSLMDVGIMPLQDTAFQSRKCAYKIVQYMAAGLPVIAADVGINADYIHGYGFEDGLGDCGIVVSDKAGWIEAINFLSSSPLDRERLGSVGKQRFSRSLSYAVIADRWRQLLRSLL